MQRCWKTNDSLYIKYHDEEWGVPVHNERKLFEFMVLDGFQAGLTWYLILQRREALKLAFDNFDPNIVSKYNSKDIERLLNAQGMIRNKAKIAATINNARVFLEVQKEYGSFDKFIWEFVNGKPILNSFKSLSELPSETEESRKMSKELKRRGFKFVGPTICYAFMQAAGLVNDHLVDCFRHGQL